MEDSVYREHDLSGTGWPGTGVAYLPVEDARIMRSSMALDWFPLWLSLRVAALATLLAAVVGIATAYLLASRDFRGKNAIDALVTLPLVLPPTVLGYYLLVLFGRDAWLGRAYEAVFGQPLVFTWQAAVVAAFFHAAPLLVKSARAALESVDHRYERAARSLGAGAMRTFFRVSLPLASRGILAALALAFAQALGDFGVTIMLAGNIPGRTQTVAVAIYDAVQSDAGSVARVLVVVTSAVAIAVVWFANHLAPKRGLS